MLNSKIIPRKSHDQVMEEIISKIPIYSYEWTNYNPSDPGMTMLEYLSAFQSLQQEQMDQVPDAVRYKLLSLLGYKPKKGAGSKVYIQPIGMTEDISIPADQRFLVGDMSFETTLERDMTSSKITGVYLKADDEIVSLNKVIDRDMYVDSYVFTEHPRKGMELYIVMDKKIEPGQEGIISIQINPKYVRNPMSTKVMNFGVLKWEYYTDNGFTALPVADESESFKVSGIMTVTMPPTEAAKYSDGPIDGYVWRATLSDASYDLPPSVRRISGFLFPAIQKETLVIAHSFQKTEVVDLNCAMLEDNYIKVYCKEEKGTSYLPYQEATEFDTEGRFFTKEKVAYGQYRFKFDKEKYGYGPASVINAIKIVIYNEEMMRKYYLGEVFGYDNQEIELPKNHVVNETFTLMAERVNDKGEKIYDFVKPGRMGGRELSYYLFENEGKIRIVDAGDYIGSKLFIASIAITLGSDGNVRAGNEFKPYGFDGGITFYNPIAGVGGAYREKLEDVRKRFVADLNAPKTAVLSSDYDRLVKQTPGLCISKVHSWMNQDRNEVQVAVLPISNITQPKLSEEYKDRIMQWMDDKRLLSTRLNVVSPKYSSVLTTGTIYVKPHYEGYKERIENVIRDELDYIAGKQQFGEVLSFEKLFHSIEVLDCVAYIHELNIVPQKNNNAKMQGSDIKPNEDCLLIPGHIKIEYVTAKEGIR